MKLTPSEIPWVTVAARVIDGKYDKADDSTKESLKIGLHNIDDPICRKAMHRLTHKLKSTK